MALPPPAAQPRNDRLLRYTSRNYSEFCLQNNIYCVPVDSAEEERLIELNGTLRGLCGGRLIFPPFPPNHDDDSEPKVLECGFGKGSWIEDVLEEYEEYNVEITGIDVYLGDGENNEPRPRGVQEFIRKRWNLNAPFSTDESHDRLESDSFDLINSRCLAEGIKIERWPSYVQDLLYLLRPGGWLQMCEIDLVFQSRAGRSVDNTFLYRWRQWYIEAMRKMDLDVRVGRALPGLMVRAGLQNVESESFNLPLGDWDTSQNIIGERARQVVSTMLESFSLWPMRRICEMREDQYRNLIEGARRELQDQSFKWYIAL